MLQQPLIEVSMNSNQTQLDIVRQAFDEWRTNRLAPALLQISESTLLSDSIRLYVDLNLYF